MKKTFLAAALVASLCVPAYAAQYTNHGDNMKVKVIDEAHEKDLEASVNQFLSDFKGEILDMKFQVAVAVSGEDQIYCFSVLILYQ